MDGTKKGNGPPPVVLAGEYYNQAVAILAELAAKTRANLIVLADMSGQLITQRGNVDGISVATLAALAAGDVAATTEMAKLIGESSQFRFLFHEGEKINIYLSNVSDHFLLIVVFESHIALGMIRVYTNRAIEEMRKLIETVKAEEQKAASVLDAEFSTLLSKELDKSFGL